MIVQVCIYVCHSVSFLLAVSVFPSSFNIQSYIREKHQSLCCDDETNLFVIAAGIRPVKNPLFLVDAFSGKAYLQLFLKGMDILPGAATLSKVFCLPLKRGLLL